MFQKSGLLALAAILLACPCLPAVAEQQADTDFVYRIDHPAYRDGPVVAVDAGHHNFHTADGRFAPFARLEAADGFQIRSLAAPIDGDALKSVGILVIANALNAANVDDWRLPTPSAFMPAEIAVIKRWVENGGSLLLIADHMPWAGAAADLAAAFGFRFVNGYAIGLKPLTSDFRLKPDMSSIDPVGLGPIDQVMTFTGQAFVTPPGAHSVLTLHGDYIALLPTVAGRFDQSTPRIDIDGYSQGAIMTVGKGRLAVFGEAAAFTAQIDSKGKRFGMNAERAEGNAPFVLTIIRWLAHYQPRS